MDMVPSAPIKSNTDMLAPFLSAMLVVMILFFIDEGYYDFRWMADAGNWFVFFIYLAIFFPLQWLISRFLFYRQTGWKKILMMVAISVPATIGFIWFIV